MRFWAALLAAMLMLTVGSLWVYHSYESEVGSVGPVLLSPVEHQENVTSLSTVTAHTPTSSLVEASCNGNGIVEVYDVITGKLVDRHAVYGHAKYQLVLPREGDYLILNNGTDKVTCSFRFIKNYPTKEVQNALYISGSVFALLLAFVVWRWAK
ncbi:hypothetical protein A3L11_08680 [Thermococcus siculi]|uniref:Uncharacterized protein n=1 Tax=Thermococcus siculi TaxID=72803 RepID=A0A2Z2MLQ4_9EURY|nr:hypothetical protein [Thermococcus siculi]ASJ09299.1 hypothetical protein A3L11_08680 [Thermococcus siculi]